MFYRLKFLTPVLSSLILTTASGIAQEAAKPSASAETAEIQPVVSIDTKTEVQDVALDVDVSKEEPNPKDKPKPIEEESTEQSRSSSDPLVDEDGYAKKYIDTLAGNSSAEDLVGATGQLQYSVPIAVPAFRDLEPQLALRYSSDVGRKAGDGAFVGVGWNVAGFSSIERISAGRGAPFYDTARDIFSLDGTELLKCSNGTINVSGVDTSAWTYSPSHIATETSASCSAGGDFVTLKNNYTKIEFDQANNKFIIYQKNGTRLVYRSINNLKAAETLIGGDDATEYTNMRKRRKWLLTEVIDTQASANTVYYTYEFGRAPNARFDGMAHRPLTITYAGYTVHFKYVVNAIPNSFSTGTRYMGKNFHMLRWIYVTEGAQNTKISAFYLPQTETGLTHAYKLNTVYQYGSDYTLSSGGWPYGGNATSYPPTTFEYSNDAFSLTSSTYPALASSSGSNSLGWTGPGAGGNTFHMDTQAVDTDGDGRDELIAFPFAQKVSGGSFFTQRAGHYKFNSDKTAFRVNASDPAQSFSSNYGDSKRVMSVSRWTPDSTTPIVLLDKVQGNSRISTQGLYTGANLSGLSDELMNPNGYRYFENGDGGWESVPHAFDNGHDLMTLTGNFDLDPDLEVYRYNDAYSFGPVNSSRNEEFWDIETIPGSNFGNLVPSAIQNAPLSASGNDYTCAPANQQNHDASLRNARVVDVNNDGIDEIFLSVQSAAYNTYRYCISEYTPNGFKTRTLSENYIERRTGNFEVVGENNAGTNALETLNIANEAMGFGDVNGDNIPDTIFHGKTTFQWVTVPYAGNHDYIATSKDWSLQVRLGRGDGTFAPAEEWFGAETFNNAIFTHYNNSVTVRDVNNDGLADVLLHTGQTTASTRVNVRNAPGPAKLFLSTGSAEHGFVKYTGSYSALNAFVTSGDFNGDGLIDFAREDQLWNGAQQPTIYYGAQGHPNRLESIATPSGNEIAIELAPSSSFPDNQVPFGRQVVTKVTSGADPAALRETTFAYSGDRYDYDARKPLGFKTVAITLPQVSGETGDMVQTTTYLNDTFVNAGLVASSELTFGGTLYSETLNVWNITGAGNGPFRIDKSDEQNTTRHGTQLITSTQDFTWTEYGEPAIVYNRGFDGASDNSWTRFYYAPNTVDYIVNLPRIKRVGTGNSPNINTSWLVDDYLYYDGADSINTVPTVGNLTKTRVWNGSVTNTSRRTNQTFTYDAYGNALTETDALGNTTANQYDTGKHLFLTSSTNALGHSSSTNWNAACQQPVTLTDANGLVANFYYDALCRETQMTTPAGQDIYTYYKNLGDPTAQHVEREIEIATTVFGETSRFEREYFNEFGETYKMAVSGRMANIEGAGTGTSVLLTKYDARGQTLWTSNPLTWAAALDNDAAANERTIFTYDPLGRVTRREYANSTGSVPVYDSISYSTAGITYPIITVAGEATNMIIMPSQTVVQYPCKLGPNQNHCQTNRVYTDAYGNKALAAVYEKTGDITDITTSASIGRYTKFRYDILGRLLDVRDQEGMRWHYEYDGFGNRTLAEDPGLGRWILEYDDNDNLTKQTDAKNQTIEFSYDELNRPTRKLVTDTNGAVATYSLYDDDNLTTTHDRAGANCWKAANPAFYNIGQLTCQTVGENRTVYDYGITGQAEKVIQFVNTGTSANEAIRTHQRYTFDGALLRQAYIYLDSAGTQQWAWTPEYKYDAAGRLVQFGTDITDVQYDLRGNPTRTDYGTGVIDQRTYNAARGWMTSATVTSVLDGTYQKTYTRSGTGRVTTVNATLDAGDLAYVYDYTGRLLSATNTAGLSQYNQSFTYDRAGRMRSNAHIGAYVYGAAKSVGTNGNSPHSHAPTTVDGATFIYDANGNMTTGLHGKVMTYDGENRPLSVSHNGTVTSYVYGPDGTRLKKIEKAGTGAENVTVYAGLTEIRNWLGSAEEVLNYPIGDVRWKNGPAAAPADFEYGYMHVDQLASVIAISDATGAFEAKRAYAPFGKIADEFTAVGATVETKGFLGERYDEDSGLQYLNARYYDPELALFIQPDWFEVTEFGVGTNRYSYSFNDPVNKLDPNGNLFGDLAAFEAQLAALTATAVQTGTTIAVGTVATIAALAGAILMASATPLADATNPELGNVLSPEQLARGDFVDGNGVLRDKDGQEVRSSTSVSTAGGTSQSQDPKSTTALPDSAWSGNAPSQVPPGVKTLNHTKYNERTNELEQSTVTYDSFGRQIERTDFTDHGYPDAHKDPHTHKRTFGPGFADGKNTRDDKADSGDKF